MKHALDDIGNTAIWASSVMIVLWVIQYSVLAPWWKSFLGITIVGEALVILAIFIPTLMALADPADYAHFATASWYLWLTVGIVVATAFFLGTRIVVWEAIRRRNGTQLLPSKMAKRIAELEAENAALHEQLERPA